MRTRDRLLIDQCSWPALVRLLLLLRLEFVLREVKEFDEFKKVFGKGGWQFVENKPYSEKALRNWQKWLSHVTDDNGCLLPGSEDVAVKPAAVNLFLKNSNKRTM